MKEIIFATKNKGKAREVSAMLRGFDIDIRTMEEAGINIDIEETGETFEENAIIKAVAVMRESGKAAIADDSGLEVDYLNGEPGVYSARYMGEETPYEIKNKKIIELLKDAKGEKRKARFICAIAVAFPDRETFVCRGVFEGYIAYEPKGKNGFGYDPIFFLPEYNMTSGEIDSELKNKISHRAKALKAMTDRLKDFF
ncbi:MAG: XTP/dITP diphosphatase [Lachnospiraceae bacterium]|nr:XTP/dITP diphosphatase [Lachnospiraceae bacterium]